MKTTSQISQASLNSTEVSWVRNLWCQGDQVDIAGRSRAECRSCAPMAFDFSLLITLCKIGLSVSRVTSKAVVPQRTIILERFGGVGTSICSTCWIWRVSVSLCQQGQQGFQIPVEVAGTGDPLLMILCNMKVLNELETSSQPEFWIGAWWRNESCYERAWPFGYMGIYVPTTVEAISFQSVFSFSNGSQNRIPSQIIQFIYHFW